MNHKTPPLWVALLLVAWALLFFCVLVISRSGLLTRLRSLAASASHPVVSAVLYVAAPSDSVIGSPSLSAAFVDRVLSSYQSPAVGLGAALYADSQTFHIDDAYAL